MKLPGNAIGISDLLDWRECPQRMEHGMRRHVVLPDGKRDEPPGHTNWTNAYGSAIHDAIHLVETEGLSNGEAIDRVWLTYGGYLDPEHLTLLREDLDSYRGDTPLGMELVAAEVDARVPLMVVDGEQIYFRFKLDALYRRTADQTFFYHRDYKSSAHRRTREEVHKDKQMWSYNWGIHMLYPEVKSLLQSYEQLKFGNYTTSKNAEQRQEMREWLERTVIAVLADETMEPKQNDWCPWCPLVVTCDQTKRATRYWHGRLAILAPETKEGRKTKIHFGDEADDLEYMMEEVLPRMIQTRKHLEAAEKALKALLGDMGSEDRARLGWRLTDRKTKTLTPDGMRVMHEAMGDLFYEVITLSTTAVEKLVGKPNKGEEPAPQLKLLREVQLEEVGSTTVVPID